MKRARTVGRQKQFYLLRGKIAVSVNAVSFLEEPSFWNDWDLTNHRGGSEKEPPFLFEGSSYPLNPEPLRDGFKIVIGDVCAFAVDQCGVFAVNPLGRR